MVLPTLRKRRPGWMTPSEERQAWFDRLWPEWARWNDEELTPSVDFYEKDGQYHVSMELPGVKKEDISVDVNNNMITVSGKKQAETEERDTGYYLKESFDGYFSRSLRLPSAVDEESVDATYKDGILKVVMDPKEEAKSRKIEVKG